MQAELVQGDYDGDDDEERVVGPVVDDVAHGSGMLWKTFIGLSLWRPGPMPAWSLSPPFGLSADHKRPS